MLRQNFFFSQNKRSFSWNEVTCSTQCLGARAGNESANAVTGGAVTGAYEHLSKAVRVELAKAQERFLVPVPILLRGEIEKLELETTLASQS